MSAPLLEPWIASRQPRPVPRIRLFCFPYAGGSAAIFRTWPQSLPNDIEVCPVQLPGRGTRLRERPFDHLLILAKVLAQVLRPLLDLPFALYGHSLGGLIAFELARELRRNHYQPVRLVVSGVRAPELAHRERAIHSLPEVEFIAELRRLDGTPDKILENPELMEIMLPLLRADFALYENYAYAVEPPLSCPIAAFGGLDDPRVARSDLEAWGDQTSTSLSLKMFRGGHFFLNTASSLFLQALSKELQ